MMVWPVSSSSSTWNVGSSSRELLDRRAELLLVALGLRLDGHVDDRVRERHRLEDDLVLRVAQRVAGGRVLEADHRVDVAGGRRVDGVLLVGVHLEQLADALLLALGRVDDLRAARHVTRVDPDVGELAEERVRRDLERQRRERLARVGRAHDDVLVVAGTVALGGGHVERRREVVEHGVEHGLDALVLERGPAQHGVDLAGDGQRADAGLELLDGELLALEVLLHEGVVALRDALEQRRGGTRRPWPAGPRGSPRPRTPRRGWSRPARPAPSWSPGRRRR